MAIRAIYLVDGFNLYHSIRSAMLDVGREDGMRWLDLPAFCRSTLAMFGSERAEVERVVYFSALAKHMEARKPDHTRRHRAYIAALEASGVEIVLSRFKKKMPLCNHCGRRTRHYEEKETDVALAVRLMEIFSTNACDAVGLVTGDSDLLPALRAVRRMYPEKRVAIVCPYRRHSHDLLAFADHSFRVGEAHYARFQLPDPVVSPGGACIWKPTGW